MVEVGRGGVETDDVFVGVAAVEVGGGDAETDAIVAGPAGLDTATSSLGGLCVPKTSSELMT